MSCTYLKLNWQPLNRYLFDLQWSLFWLGQKILHVCLAVCTFANGFQRWHESLGKSWILHMDAFFVPSRGTLSCDAGKNKEIHAYVAHLVEDGPGEKWICLELHDKSKNYMFFCSPIIFHAARHHFKNCSTEHKWFEDYVWDAILYAGNSMHCQVWGENAHLVPVGLEKSLKGWGGGKSHLFFCFFVSRAATLSWDKFFFLNWLSLEGGACHLSPALCICDA